MYINNTKTIYTHLFDDLKITSDNLIKILSKTSNKRFNKKSFIRELKIKMIKCKLYKGVYHLLIGLDDYGIENYYALMNVFDDRKKANDFLKALKSLV